MQAAGLTRSIGNFGRFFDVAGLTNGEQVNFAKVASDTGLAPSTVREHYRILEDALVGDHIPLVQPATSPCCGGRRHDGGRRPIIERRRTGAGRFPVLSMC